MSGLWTIRVPPTSAVTNLWTNPSAELDLTGLSATSGAPGATVTRVLTYAKYGIASISCVCDGTNNNQGVETPGGASGVAVSSSTAYSLYAWAIGTGTVTVSVRWFNSGGTFVSANSGTGIALSATQWSKLSVTAT